MRTNGKCQCNEGILQREKKNAKTGEEVEPEIRAPLVHDCEYIAERNALIPAAVKMISDRSPGISWDRAFHDAMNRLWELRKLRVVEA